MKIAVIRGRALNKWEMQNFEPMAARRDIVAVGALNGSYPTDSIRMPVTLLKTADAAFEKFGKASRIAARLGIVRRPPDTLVGLEELLAGVSVAHGAETSISFTEQAVRAKKIHGLKVAVTCWETIPFAYEEDPIVHERAIFIREHADLFLATTQRAARALAIEGVNPDRIRVVMPGVDTGRFRPGDRSPSLAADLGIDKDDIVLLFIGRLIPEKGVRELLVAYSLALRSLPPSLSGRCRLLIAGNGPRKAFAETLLTDLDLRDRAGIVGGMDYMEIHKLHQLADIFVLPSICAPYWEEQFGMVLAEAMACGKPVISTATGGIPEVVGDAGILPPPLEPDALAGAMTQLIRDKERRLQLGARARDRAVSRFDSETVAAEIENIYQDLSRQPEPAYSGVK
jgi:glycosyltransferase involved in cell wall biosynthesis